MTIQPVDLPKAAVPPSPVLAVSGLTVSYSDRNGARTAVHGIDFHVNPG